MSARDELAEVIANFRDDWYKVKRMSPADIDRDEASAILAAGYSKPRTISTVEELGALPEGSVVLDGDVCVRRDDGYWKVSDLAGVYASNALALPATVLYTPKES